MKNESMKRTRAAVALASTLFAMGLTTSASAADWIIKDSSPKTRSPRVDATVHFTPGASSNFGVSGWYVLPIVPNGFIKSLNDQFNLEFGASFDRHNYEFNLLGTTLFEQSWYTVTPMGGVRWDFHLTPSWTVFGKGKIGYSIGFAEDFGGYASRGVTQLVFDTGVGAYYHFSNDLSLRLEIGTFGLATVGLSLPL